MASRRHPSVNMPLEAGKTIEQVFPNPAEPDHAPDAEPWTIERMDPETVRLNATTSKRPLRPNLRDSPPRLIGAEPTNR